MVRKVKLCKYVEEWWMTYSVESLGEVQWDDDDVGFVDDSRLMTVLRTAMMAAVVEPVGLKANWSINHNEGGGDDNAHITPDHNSLNNAGKFWCDRYRPRSAVCCGAGVFGIGRMCACFHWFGTDDVNRSDQVGNWTAEDRRCEPEKPGCRVWLLSAAVYPARVLCSHVFQRWLFIAGTLAK